MTGFLIKKFFFDFWDNLFVVIAINFCFLLFLSLVFILFPILQATENVFVFFIVFFVLVYWLLVYLCSAVSILKDASDYRRPNPVDFFKNIKNACVPAAVLFVVLVFVSLIIRFTIPVYLKMGNIAGLAAAFFSCWICLFIITAIQFYPSVYYRLGMHPLKSLKKCAIIVIDNTFFSLFSLAFSIILTVLILPAPGCPLLFLDEAIRLRLLKYDWLEDQAAQQGENFNLKTKIPWNELLEAERENTGKRSWKSFIFPWKM